MLLHFMTQELRNHLFPVTSEQLAQARELDGPARTLFESEARYTDLYGLCFPAPRPCGAEWIHSPVVGERA